MAERKKLLDSQRELIRLKREKINEALAMAEMRKNELQASVNLIATELGIPEGEQNWRLNKTDDYIEKIVQKKKPKETTVKGNKKKKK